MVTLVDFVTRSRLDLFKRLRELQIGECPFANVPEAKAGRWGAGLTAAEMAECRWVKSELVGQFEFVELDAGKSFASLTLRSAERETRTPRMSPVSRNPVLPLCVVLQTMLR
jgi:hypothetical protein